MERSQGLVSDAADRDQKNAHTEDALRIYPKWTFDEVRNQIEQKKQKKNRKSKTSLHLAHQW